MNKHPRLDRRRFVRLMAAGAALVSTARFIKSAEAGPAKVPAATAPSPHHRLLTPAMRKELLTQKKSVRDLLAVVRGFELPPGSPPASIFRAQSARNRR